MKYLTLLLFPLIAACDTMETFDVKGNRTSRTSKPSPETWTVISNAVATAGVQAVITWANQMAQQQQWEKAGK